MFEELAVSTGEHELLLMGGRVCRHACVGWSTKGYGRSGLFVGRWDSALDRTQDSTVGQERRND